MKNLLVNPNFDEGYHHQDNIPEIVVPDGWQLYWTDKEVFPGASGMSYRPESVVWNIKDAPPHEKPLFFLSGNYCWKIFKANAPVYFAITQKVSGLTPGAKYRFTAKVFPDIVERYEGGHKVYPGDIWSAESRVGWSYPDTPWPHAQDGDVHWAPWFNKYSHNFEFGQYNDIWLEFVAPDNGEVRVWLECKAKWGFENNWFMDSFSLEMTEPAPGGETGEPVVPPPEEETPVTPPTPGKPARGLPRQQYVRTYFLLPPSISQEMALAAMRVAYKAHATVGFSPDDAGIGDLDRRLVVCINPTAFTEPLDQAWYDHYYPGVKFITVEANNATELEGKLSSLF